MSKPIKPIRIAIVEDDESLCRSLARLLRASGYNPVSYLSAEALLNGAAKPVFDCMLVDIQLGGMSGIELGARLADDGSTVPLIYLTAHEDWQALKQSVANSCAGFLRKSDPAESLLATIRQAIDTAAIKTAGAHGHGTG